MHPAALLARLGEDLPERRPEAERTVADDTVVTSFLERPLDAGPCRYL